MSEIPIGYWPCACVRRDKDGNLSRIKMNPPHRRVCSVCKAKRPAREAAATEGDR